MFQDPSVRDASSKGRLPGAPQSRDASSETFSSETKRNGTEYLVHVLPLSKDKKAEKLYSLMFDTTAMSV